MLRSFCGRLSTVLLGMALSFGSLPALANNLPGSPGTVIPELTETATETIVGSVKDGARALRQPSSGLQVSVSSSGTMEGLGGSVGTDMPIALKLNFRSIDTDEVDGSIVTGNVLFGQTLGSQTLVFGGLITEQVQADTPLNQGTIDATGLGLTAGADFMVNDRFYLSGILGLMRLDYDVSRTAGLDTGSFEARRGFIDLSGDYITKAGRADLLLGFGLLYVNQKNDGYMESGGATVDAFSSERLSGKLSSRAVRGTDGAVRPYVDAETSFRLSGSSGLDAALAPDHSDDWSGRLAFGIQRATASSGFDLGIGANFGTGSFEGLDANLRYALRF